MSETPAYAVFLPVYNEEALIETHTIALREYLLTLGKPFQIWVGSNGSTDKTVSLGESLAQRFAEVRFFHLARRAPGEAFFEASQRMTAPLILTMDMDLSTSLTFIPEALTQLEKAAIVIGSKKMGVESRSWARRAGSDFFIFCSKKLMGLPYDDYSLGAKAYQRAVVLRYPQAQSRGTFYVQHLVYLAFRDGLPIQQIAVDCKDGRKSRFNLVLEGLYKLTRMLSVLLFR